MVRHISRAETSSKWASSYLNRIPMCETEKNIYCRRDENIFSTPSLIPSSVSVSLTLGFPSTFSFAIYLMFKQTICGCKTRILRSKQIPSATDGNLTTVTLQELMGRQHDLYVFFKNATSLCIVSVKLSGFLFQGCRWSFLQQPRGVRIRRFRWVPAPLLIAPCPGSRRVELDRLRWRGPKRWIGERFCTVGKCKPAESPHTAARFPHGKQRVCPT